MGVNWGLIIGIRTNYGPPGQVLGQNSSEKLPV